MLQWLLSFIGGPIIKGALDAYKLRLQSINSQDQMALDLLKKEIEADIDARAEATKLIIAEQGHWYTAMVRPLFALPFIIFEMKVIIYDKVLHLGVTDKLDPHMWYVFNLIVVSYFGASAVERVSRIFRR